MRKNVINKNVIILLSIVCLATLFIVICSVCVHAADQHPEPGTEFGTGCRWAIDSDGVLWIWPTDGVSGTLPSYDAALINWPWYSRRTSVKKVVVEDGVKTSAGCRGLFYGMNNCTEMQLENLDVSSATNMEAMFRNCSSLTSLPVENWDVSSVTDMCSMFEGCSSLTSLPMESWDVGAVTDMSLMFYDCNSLTSLPVENWDVSAVTNMQNMFFMLSKSGSLTSLPVENWDVSSVTNMNNMFYNCGSLTDLPVEDWDVSAVTNMRDMFNKCSSLTSLSVGSWDVGAVTNMNSMFYKCSSLTGLSVENWDVGAVTDMYELFSGCSSLTSLSVGSWDVGAVTNMRYMFASCNSLTTIDLTNWDTSKATKMGNMFNISGLSSITLGGDFKFKGNNITTTSEMARLYDPPADITTRKWIMEDGGAGPLSSTELRDQYDANAAAWQGKWVWQVNETSAVIHFDANGGYTPQSQITQTNITSVTIPEATKPAYYLVEWNTNADGTGAAYHPGDSFTPTGGTHTTFYAIWDNAAEYQVNHYQQNAALTGYDLIETQTLYGKPNAEATPPPKTYAHYITPQAHTIIVADDGSTVVDYYYDRASYTIHFNGNDATSGAIDDQIVISGMTAKLYDNKFTRDGYAFVCWNTKADGTGASYGDAQTVSNLTEDNTTVTLYAQWLKITDKNAEYSNGKYVFHIKAGETALIPELPAGVSYSVEEIDNPGGWSKSDEENVSGSIAANTTTEGSVTNAYTAIGFASIVAHKDMVGREASPGEFSFELKEGSKILQTKTNGERDVEEEVLLPNDKTEKNPYYDLYKVNFDNIEYALKDVGRHTYTIREVSGSDDGIEYDTHIETVTVNVTDAGNGTLNTEVQYDADGAVFTNSLKNVLEDADIEDRGDIQITKKIIGEYTGDTFEFALTLTDENGLPLTSEFQTDIVDSTDKDSYRIKTSQMVSRVAYTQNLSDRGEQISNYGLNWNDSKIVNRIVTIPGAKSLHIEIVYGGESNRYDWACVWQGNHPEYTAASNYTSSFTGKLGGGSHTSVSNTKNYDVPGNTVTFGFHSDNYGCGDGYGFYAVVSGLGQTMEYVKQPIDTVTLTNGSNVHLQAGQTAVITNVPVGAHYKVEEILGGASNYELVSQTDTEGALTGDNTPEAVFTNICTATGSFTPQVTKVYNGGDLAEESFTFELYDDSGAIIDTATTDNTGAVIFNPIDYSPSDIGQTFHYTVRERPGDAPDVQYDEHIEDINVIVNTGTGADLDIQATYSTGGVFTNARMFEANLSKQAGFGLTGDNITGATLTITDTNGTPIQTITTDGSPLYATMLPAGDYILKETTTPTGYKTAENIPFTVTDAGTIEVNSEATDTITMIDEIDGHDLSITKQVRGNFGDRHEDFNFKVTFTTPVRELKILKNGQESTEAINPAGQTFTLKHGETITFKNLPTGTEYVIEETTPVDYTMTSTNASGTIAAENITATFTNTRQGAVPTSTIPIGMSAAVIAGAAIIITAKKKKA